MKYEIALDRQLPNSQRDKTSLGYSTGLLQKDLKIPYFTLSSYYFVPQYHAKFKKKKNYLNLHNGVGAKLR